MRSWTRRLRDQIVDVAIELSSRMSRTMLMTSAVAFSTGAMLMSVGISENAAFQVDVDIAASANRDVVVAVAESAVTPVQSGKEGEIATIFTADTEERLTAIDTVENAGLRLDVNGTISPDVIRPALGDSTIQVGVEGATSGYLDAANISASGNSAWMLDGELNVALVGETATRQLGITQSVDLRGISVMINGTDYSVVGFISGENAFLDALVIPYSCALQLVGGDKWSEVLIRSALGAGSQISNVARVAILPSSPEKLTVSQVVAHGEMRDTVSDQLTKQATWIGGFLLILTILLITNSMIVSVTARTTEIGVRRALGASRSSVAGVFWVEGALIGALGVLAGAAVAFIAVDVVAILNQWTAHLNPVWIAIGTGLGMMVGILASAYPALRAAAIQPAIAVRSD